MFFKKSFLSKVLVFVLVGLMANLNMVFASPSQTTHKMLQLKLTKAQFEQFNKYLVLRNSPKPLTQQEYKKILNKINYRRTRSSEESVEISNDVYNAMMNAPVTKIGNQRFLLAACWLVAAGILVYTYYATGQDLEVAHLKRAHQSYIKDQYGRIFVEKGHPKRLHIR